MQAKHKPQILVVEQSGMMMSVITSLLHQLSYDNVIRENSAKNARERLENIRFNLIICDWYERSADILDFIQFVRSQSRTANVPLVMISGVVDHDDVEHAISLGVTEYIVKPFTPQLFEEKINRAMKAKVSAPLRTELQQDETSTFNSKVILSIENLAWQAASKEVLSKFMLHCTSKMSEVLPLIKKDKQYDVVVIDESIAAHQTDGVRALLQLVQLGQIEVILVSNNMEKNHISSVKKLGIKHIVNPDVDIDDLLHRIEMISTLKQALLHTNQTVRKAEMIKQQESQLHCELTDSVKKRAENISSLSEQLALNAKGSHFISGVAKELKRDSFTIGSITDALKAVDSSVMSTVRHSKEKLKLKTSIDNAVTIFAQELQDRNITINVDAEVNADKSNEKDCIMWANPTLFNSLFMFIVKSLIQEALYGEIINVQHGYETNEETSQVDVILTISTTLAGFPKLTWLAEKVVPFNDAKISIRYKEAIRHLIQSELIDIGAQYNETQKQIVLVLRVATEAKPQL